MRQYEEIMLNPDLGALARNLVEPLTDDELDEGKDDAMIVYAIRLYNKRYKKTYGFKPYLPKGEWWEKYHEYMKG